MDNIKKLNEAIRKNIEASKRFEKAINKYCK